MCAALNMGSYTSAVMSGGVWIAAELSAAAGNGARPRRDQRRYL
jgi:hypothetical protein